MNQPTMPALTAPKAPRAKNSGVSAHIADVKARARKMLATGSISQKQHDGLIAKANMVTAALDGENASV